MVRCIAQRGYFNNNYTSDVEIVLPELNATNSVAWDFDVDESEVNYGYNMIRVRDILSKIKIDLLLSDNTIQGNEGT